MNFFLLLYRTCYIACWDKKNYVQVITISNILVAQKDKSKQNSSTIWNAKTSRLLIANYTIAHWRDANKVHSYSRAYINNSENRSQLAFSSFIYIYSSFSREFE